ncbi:Nucleic acid-binding, OB-fold [Sesbania bispinosa]|nr:Nucleic acid-binding, OB-fold [Sesbania bispinosa]
MACSCMRAVNFGRGYPYCDDCQRVVYDMTPRYKVKILVSDGDDSAHLLMWDSECYSLLNKSCHDMLSDNKGDEYGPYHEEMLNWVDKEMLFRIERKKDSTFGYDESFKVRRICSDSTLISDLKDIVDDDTPLKVVSRLDVSPLSIAKPSSYAEDCSVLSKRCGDTTLDEGVARRKLPRNKVVKVEKP